MLPPPEFLAGAEIEFNEAYEIFGDRFYEQVDRALDIIRNHPEAGPPYFRSIRRILVLKTNFALYYSVFSQPDIDQCGD